MEGAHPTEPPQHLRDMGTEHAAVVMTLVDDDQVERPEQTGPPFVTG